MTIHGKRIDPVNSLFMIFSHLMGLLGIVLYAFFLPLSWATLGLAAVWMFCCGLSITGGYHRLFSHMAYKAHPALRLFYLLFGAAAVQNSALKWCADHRRHHQMTDEEEDPYNIKKGFWWAHIGWVFTKEAPPDYGPVPDLARDPLVQFQHRWYLVLAVTMGLALPTLIGAAWGDALGAFFLVGWVRLVVLWHFTFSVNSFAHYIGRQPYTLSDSSRDSGVTALITMGEGYHNFHHRFPWDYRNGVERHQFDPTKWTLRALSHVGLTSGLKRVPRETILKARLATDQLGMSARVAAKPEGASWEARIEAARVRLERLLERWQELKQTYAARRAELGSRASSQLRELRAELRMAKDDFRRAYRTWRACVHRPELLPAVA